MQILENISLKIYNTFHIDVKARWFTLFQTWDELNEALHLNLQVSTSQLVLGGGSNILFTGDFDGLILKNEIKGIELLHEDEEYVYVKAGAGEIWHRFILYCISHDWAGLENLSLIPGNVGAAPIQNIGAYGVELSEVFWSLEAFHLFDKKKVTFTIDNCEFGYRESIFKKKYKNQFVIMNVTFRLRKYPAFHTSYGAINQELEKMGIKELNIKAISQAVINIRSSKLPYPEKIGNAGSFFKNPSVSKEKFENLKSKFKNIIGHEQIDGTIKLAAAWLIEQCGPKDSVSWKDFRKADAGVHTKQALVLVNYENASGKEIFDLASEIQQSVKEKFDVGLEIEVNII